MLRCVCFASETWFRVAEQRVEARHFVARAMEILIWLERRHRRPSASQAEPNDWRISSDRLQNPYAG